MNDLQGQIETLWNLWFHNDKILTWHLFYTNFSTRYNMNKVRESSLPNNFFPSQKQSCYYSIPTLYSNSVQYPPISNSRCTPPPQQITALLTLLIIRHRRRKSLVQSIYPPCHHLSILQITTIMPCFWNTHYCFDAFHWCSDAFHLNKDADIVDISCWIETWCCELW